jgi:hypothetical protein
MIGLARGDGCHAVCGSAQPRPPAQGGEGTIRRTREGLLTRNPPLASHFTEISPALCQNSKG